MRPRTEPGRQHGSGYRGSSTSRVRTEPVGHWIRPSRRPGNCSILSVSCLSPSCCEDYTRVGPGCTGPIWLILVNYPAGDEETVGIKPGVHVGASRSHSDRSRHAVVEVLDARDIEGKGVEVLFGHVHLHLM